MLDTVTVIAVAVGFAVSVLVFALLQQRSKENERTQIRRRHEARHRRLETMRSYGA